LQNLNGQFAAEAGTTRVAEMPGRRTLLSGGTSLIWLLIADATWLAFNSR